jgi:ATP-dependent Clp protease ATP-binding subunit ClpC
MNIQFEQFKKLNAFTAYFFPHLNFEKKELNKNTADQMIRYLAIAVDTLIKGENLYKKRNLILPENQSFFVKEPIDLLGNINLYLYRFDTQIFSFTRTERQTFIFIIENIIDYFKRSRLYTDKKEQKNLFNDYRFWIENFFKMVNQKITGSIYSSKKLHLKNFFNSNDSLNNELIYSNSAVSFSISPFALSRENKNLFLYRVDIENGILIYTDWNLEKQEEIPLDNAKYDMKVYEFMFSNFEFSAAEALKPRLDSQGQKHILVEYCERIINAVNYHKKRLFQESYNLLREISFENLDLPLVYLLQIKNLVNINRIFEVKKLMQKFVLLYPYYSEGYEIMGDIYLKEEDYELALNFYEKVLKLTQNKRVAEKLKRVRDAIEKNKQQLAKEKNDNFFDLTESVFHSENKLLSRERELRQMVEVLLSESRRNLILVGDSGVGKTALLRLLAERILNRDVPDQLIDKRLKEINFVSLLTGSKYRGQFEEKVVKLLTEFKTQKAILVLEDIHLMIASGTPRGTSLDLVNILKPFLREKSIQVIATTNYEEFKNTIEKDNTLMGFFQKITINEMNAGDTRKVLKALTENAFSNDKIIISDEVVDQVVESSRRDIRDKKCPDSAVMLLERAIAKVKYKFHMDDVNRFEVDAADVAEAITDMLNLPESNVPLSLKQRLLKLEGNLLNEIIGQNDAIKRMTASIITSKLDFDIKKNRPDGVFLFIGPTGVGKTESALALARTLYGSEDYIIRIDMSEYMEKFTYSRFVGAAPGYVGYMDSNQLTDKVRQNPYSIILLDEIEKADSQLLNIFLQVFDAGRLTDARGNVVDFSHATIIMTSNIGTSLFSKINVGYQADFKKSDVSHASLLKALKRYFSPEFLNRVDEILIFNHLKEGDIKRIIEIQLQATREQLEKQNKELIIPDNVLDFIIENGYSPEYGARHLARTLRKYILEKVAHLSLEKDWNDAGQIICSIDKNLNQVTVHMEPTHPMEPETITPIEESKIIAGLKAKEG